MDAITTVTDYHDRTKHHVRQFAASLGYLDWANQPDPFRRFVGAPVIALRQIPPVPEPRYDDLFDCVVPRPPAPVNADTVAQLFHDSLALSAWKVAGTARWSLRVNPSSGNLHPTEGYLLCGPIDGLAHGAGLYHYAPREHALELRRPVPLDLWNRLLANSGGTLLVALTSIHWREAWKYGERAYRYCQHDVGHALAALGIACAVLGWRPMLIETLGDLQLARLLALDCQAGPEAEHPDLLLAIGTGSAGPTPSSAWPDPRVLDDIATLPVLGEPNRLSHDHHPWPVIDVVTAAAQKPSLPSPPPLFRAQAPLQSLVRAVRPAGARGLIRQRRSAVAMDGHTSIPAGDFLAMLARLVPATPHPVWDSWPWPVSVHLALFVHRITGLPRGLYWLSRDAGSTTRCRQAFRSEFTWSTPSQCPPGLDLFQLEEGDFGEVANVICCQQSIAEEGAFAVAMVAEFEPRLVAHGPWFYRRLFWETGLIGQLLYLEAEAAGVRGTGIGCYFDDALHQLLGIENHAFQSLYHFTIGGPVEDPRLRTIQPGSISSSSTA
jgi:SagB-type dehydrogenase family enzyme